MAEMRNEDWAFCMNGLYTSIWLTVGLLGLHMILDTLWSFSLCMYCLAAFVYKFISINTMKSLESYGLASISAD